MIASIHRAVPSGLRLGAAGLLLAGLVATAPRPVAAGSMRTVETGGFADLTVCRSWLLFQSCSHYHHVAVPARFALGSTIRLTFGSNIKQMRYTVIRISQDGAHCTIFDAAAGGDTLDVTPCRVMAPEAASSH